MPGPPGGSPCRDEACDAAAERRQRPGAGEDAGRLCAEGQPPGEDLPGGVELEAQEIHCVAATRAASTTSAARRGRCEYVPGK